MDKKLAGLVERVVPESTWAVVPPGDVVTVSSEPTRLMRTEPRMAVGVVTEKVKEVVFVTPPPAPITVTG